MKVAYQEAADRHLLFAVEDANMYTEEVLIARQVAGLLKGAKFSISGAETERIRSISAQLLDALAKLQVMIFTSC